MRLHKLSSMILAAAALIGLLGGNEGVAQVSAVKAGPSAHQTDSGYDPIALDSVIFDTTGGATPGMAWQNGLFHISGSYLADGGSSGGQGMARLMVNGTAVEHNLFDTTSGLWDSQTFSTYLLLNENDIVTMEVDSPGSYNAHAAPFTNLTMVGFNSVPEPSSFTLLGIGAISLLTYIWRRQAA